MILSSTYRLSALPSGFLLEATPDTLTLSADNVASVPLTVAFYDADGDRRTPRTAWLTLEVLAGEDVLYTYKSTAAVSSYTYTWPSDKYATADSIRLSAYGESSRSTMLAEKRVGIIAANPVPFPRSETEWGASLTFKNGEFILLDGTVYMWVSRVPGNTDVDPKTYIAQGTLPRVWTAYQEWPLLATQVMLARYALLGDFVFNGKYMHSQQGTDADGQTSEDYRQLDTADPMGDGKAYRPNFLIDAVTGEAWMELANVRGNLSAGTIGSFTIDKGLRNVAISPEAFIEIIKNSGFAFRVNSPANSSVVSIENDDERAYALHITSRKGGRGIYVNSLSSVEDDVAIAARGNCEFATQDGETVRIQRLKSAGLRMACRGVDGVASATLTQTDDFVWFRHSGNIRATLPDPRETQGKTYWCKILNGSVTLTTPSGIIFDSRSTSGTATHTANAGESFLLLNDGGNWFKYACGQ